MGMVVTATVASAPLAVLSGGVTTIIGTTGVVGLSLLYVLVGGALLAFTVACSALTRHTGLASGLHTYVARGLGERPGAAIAALALLSYTMLGVSYYGILGFEVTRLIEDKSGASVPWFPIVLPVIGLIAVLGTRSLRTGVIVLTVVLGAILVATLLFGATTLRFPSPVGLTGDSLNPVSLLSGAIGAAIGFVITAYPGVEIPLALGSELRASAKSVTRSMFLAVLVIGGLNTLAGWLVTSALGPDRILQAGTDKGSDLVTGFLADKLGEGAVALYGPLNLVAVIGAILAFHYTTAQYVRTLADSGVLPPLLSYRSPRTGAPVTAPLARSALSVVMLTVLALFGAHPLWTVFMLLSHVGAIGVFVMLVVTSIAAMVFLLRTDSEEDDFFGWEGRLIAGVLATICLGIVLLSGLFEAHVRLNVPSGSPVVWVPPGLVIIALTVGLFWPRRLGSAASVPMVSLAAYKAEPAEPSKPAPAPPDRARHGASANGWQRHRPPEPRLPEPPMAARPIPSFRPEPASSRRNVAPASGPPQWTEPPTAEPHVADLPNWRVPVPNGRQWTGRPTENRGSEV
jgi:amino acid transporter